MASHLTQPRCCGTGDASIAMHDLAVAMFHFSLQWRLDVLGRTRVDGTRRPPLTRISVGAGMRAVMAVLRAAGNLKRRFPSEDEFVLMLRSIIDVNLCKFLADDVPLFRGIVGDLFLGVTLPKADYATMEAAMTDAAVELNLQPTPYCFMKAIQLYEMVLVRHGLMIVGHPFAAKTSSYRLLASAAPPLYYSTACLS